MTHHSFANMQTGRTTRMIREAIRLAQEGRAVYVLAANGQHKVTLAKMGGMEAHQSGVKFECVSAMSNFNWRTMKLEGAHPNCVVLVDHYTIQWTYQLMLNELHRYDKE